MHYFRRNFNDSSRSAFDGWLIAELDVAEPFQNINHLMLDIVVVTFRSSTRLQNTKRHLECAAEIFLDQTDVNRPVVSRRCIFL